MKKSELVYRELLFNAIEKKNNKLTQLELSKKLSISLSTVNNAIKPLVNMGAIQINLRNLRILDIKKILYHWANIRNLKKDIIYSTRIEKPVREIEKTMPDNIIFTAYSGYKIKFNDVPADYSEIYVYGDESIKERFPKNNGIPNLFVLKKDIIMKEITIANLFVDLWNIKEWYSKEFIKSLEAKLHGILE
ncbi:winged helix-turn-helix transcriptional regulator [Candidatus Woesearchaeota archaeon]|nr:winged helix-turn-helix transcriptional regulator [Candidatus Woesearchaeota archaeon]